MTAKVDSDFLGLGGRVCVVTGAGSGIGRAIALAFAGNGAIVTAIDRNPEACAATVADIVGRGGRAAAITCDVGNPASVAAAGERSAELSGPCDVLVNDAGILRAGGLDVLTAEDWNSVLEVNLTGYFLCAQTFGRQMRAKGKGSLIHVASIAATQATGFSGAYSVAKAGIVMLSRLLAVEWGKDGIRSNSISPGMIWTPMTQAAYERPGMAERRSQAIPVGRIGRPEEIADVVLFLASDRGAYISGEDVTVDGGFTRNLMGLMPRTAQDGAK